MLFVLAGASGFLGTAWRDHLAQQGHEVVRLVRGDALSAHESHWDPYTGQVDRDLVERADVVANLAGAPLAHWPWTSSYQRTFLDSRVATTRTLAAAVAGSEHPATFVAQSGVAGYGDRGAEVVTEDTPIDADTFMGHVVREWEAATEAADAAGVRVVTMRTGVIVDKDGGALKLLLPAFRIGLGGPVGSGEQFFATISLRDWCRAASHVATNPDASGAYNLSGPETTTNRDFGNHLARMLRRPAKVPLPAFAVRAAARPVASELLNSTRVEPARLLADGFEFDHPTLDARLAAALA